MPERERRPRRSVQARDRKAEQGRNTSLPVPTTTPITFRGEAVTPGHILRLWREGTRLMQASRDLILKIRAFRRKEEASLIQLDPRWRRLHPEAARWVREVMEHRTTLESNLVARIGAVEPEFSREPLGFLDSDHTDAEACESYMEEWRKRSIPFEVYIGKGTEDGQYGQVVLPAADDLDGVPDFYEMLDEMAYDALDEDAKGEYERDEVDRRGRYVKMREGKKVRKPEYEPEPLSETDKQRPRASQEKLKDDREDRVREKHDAAVQRFLLQRQASNVRVIPALNCAPIFVEGKARGRWELAALVERQLCEISELEESYNWKNMGSRKLLPLAYGTDGSLMQVAESEIGEGERVYRYTAYLLCKDTAGKRRPIIASTIGCTATWDGVSGNEDDPQSVAFVDLYEQYKTKDGACPALEGVPLWSYHWGLHNQDDDPAYYSRPYLEDVYSRILSIEGNKTSINAATRDNAFTGYWQPIDGKVAEAMPEAVLEDDGELRRPKIPGVGEIEPTTGMPIPAQQATVGRDAWQGLAADMQALDAATAIDQVQTGATTSGRAQVVQSSLAMVAKRQIRDGALDATVRAGEMHLRILTAIEHKWGIRWPLQTTQERPVGSEVRSGRAPAEFDPDWVGDGHFTLTAEYPEEENLARIDLEASLKERRLSTLKRVARAMGEKDTEAFRAEILKDAIWEMPETVMAAQSEIARRSGNRTLQKIIKLRDAQMMAQQDIPGIGAVPSAALRRQGQQQGNSGGGGGQSAVSRMRGGIQASEMGTAAEMAEGEARMAVGA